MACADMQAGPVGWWENSADDKLKIFFLFFQENRLWYFMQIVSEETICMKYQTYFLKN